MQATDQVETTDRVERDKEGDQLIGLLNVRMQTDETVRR